MTNYAVPEALVDTEWVAAHLNDPKVRIIESNEDVLLYETGHIPGAVKLDWVGDLNDPVVRDYLDRPTLRAAAEQAGHFQRHDDRAVWRQKQLVGDLRPVGLQAVWPRGRPDPERWPQEVDRRGPRTDQEVPSMRQPNITPRNAMTTRSARSAIRYALRWARSRWSMCARPTSTAARSCTCRNIPRKARCAAATSRPLRASRGRRQSTRTAPSSRASNLSNSTAARALRPTRM